MKIISRLPFALVFCGAALLANDTALAQAWIGQIVGDMIAQQHAAEQEHLCMTGTAMPSEEVEETRAGTYAAIGGYRAAVQGGAIVSVRVFFHNDRKATWLAGEKTVALAGLDRIADPFVLSGATFDPHPIAYIRAGDGGTVFGQWAVRRTDGSLVGTYDAMFTRMGGVWKLSRLTLFSATDYVQPLVQFCHKPNDVLPYRLSSTQNTRIYTAKRAAKMILKATKAQDDADRIIAKGDVRSQSESEAVTALDKARRARDAQAKAALAVEEARKAVEANELAKSDASAAEAAKAAAIAALSPQA